MNKIVVIILTSVIFSFISCSNLDERDFFNFVVEEVEDSVPSRILSVNNIGNVSAKLDGCVIADGLIVSYDGKNDDFFAITDLQADSLIGKFCSKGRSWNAPVSAIPLSELMRDSLGLVANVFSFADGKLLEWCVSQSINNGKTEYRSIIDLKSGNIGILPLMSVYSINRQTVIAYNSGQITDNRYCAPAYEVYDLKDGNIIKRYELFNNLESITDDGIYTPRVYLSNQDCVRPGRKKLAFGMFYMPIWAILDTDTGECKGMRLGGKRAFDQHKRICHFMDMQCDNDFIYALYWGSEARGLEDYPGLLYVFDWEGRIVNKLKIPERFTNLQLDGDRLYFLNFLHDSLAYVDLPL